MCVSVPVCVVSRLPHRWAETGEGACRSPARELMVCEVTGRQGHPAPGSQGQGWAGLIS